MTHSGGQPHAVGDRGQRFEVRFRSEGEEKTFGWSNDLEGVAAMVGSIEAHPTWNSPIVIDRETGERATYKELRNSI